MMLGKTQTFFLQYFCRESAFCGALMTHKLPHKTDVGFLEPIRPITIVNDR